MTADQALEVIANEVIRAALEEMVDNGLWETYVDADLSESSGAALRRHLTALSDVRPDTATLTAAVAALEQGPRA